MSGQNQRSIEPDPPTTEGQWAHIGEYVGCGNHDHDLVNDLSRRLDALWRYDRFVANAEGNKDLQDCWRELKKQDLEAIERLKDIMKNAISKGCF